MDLTFTALLLPLDALALYAAAVSAYSLRFSRFVTEVRPILQNVNFPEYISAASFFVLVWIGLFAIAGLYSPRARKAWDELGRIILTCGAGTMVVIATVFFRREITTSRFIILAVLGFSILYVLVGRLVLRTIRHLMLRYRIGHRLFVVIGSSEAARYLTDAYRERPVMGITVVRHFKSWNNETRKAVQALKDKDALDGLILAEPEMDKDDALGIIAFADEHHLTFRYLADLFAAKFTNIEVLTDSGIPVIEVKRTPLDGWGRIAKRAFDIFGAVFFLMLFSPLLLLACLALIIEDGIPVIFQNLRVGEGGRQFKLYKLRTMWRKFSIGPQFKEGAKERLELEKKLIKQKSIKEGPVYKIAADPRITPIGNFLRRWSIDELPQFWNVLKGDMSIVGPRPHQPREVAGYAPHHRRVFAIRPGITGMAQISGRSDLEFEDEVRLDTWYIENWSLWKDLYIVLKTPFAVLYRKGAY
jgi:exopolysaccharide biosynthesis polyprenyl glycosylphosphotransferase